MPRSLYDRFKLPVFFVVMVLAGGTLGYHFLDNQNHSLLDALYMTVITITTIGYGEIIDTSQNPQARVFTIFLAFAGIGVATFFLSQVTAVIVEGDIKETFKRRKMKKEISKMEGHYIVCGSGKVGSHILEELHRTGRSVIVIDKSDEIIAKVNEHYPDVSFILGDADIEDTLLEGGVMRAKGVFASTGDDNQNLVISLTAKYLNPNVRVVARCLQAANQAKMKRAGADTVISENFIAGMRMASEMVRPMVVSFLDKMLTDKEKNLRVEEIILHSRFEGATVGELNLDNFPDTLLLAIAHGEEWIYNPKPDNKLGSRAKLILITSTEERMLVEKELGAD